MLAADTPPADEVGGDVEDAGADELV